MRRKGCLGVTLVAAAAAWAADPIQPLNLKPGLWQTTLTVRTDGMPPMPPELAQKLTPAQRALIDSKAKARAAGPQTSVSKTCLEEPGLNQQLLLNLGTDRQGCKQTTKSLAGRQDVHVECAEGSVKSSGTIRIETSHPEGFKVTSDWLTSDGSRSMKMTSTAVGKWLGGICEVELPPGPAKPRTPTPRSPAVAVPEKPRATPDAGTLEGLGKEETNGGHFREAVGILDRAIALDPERATAYNARGYAYLRLHDFAAAVRDFSEAIRLRPEYANAYQNRAVARRRAGDAKGAAEDEGKAAALTRPRGKGTPDSRRAGQ